jgi:hypothetical protein
MFIKKSLKIPKGGNQKLSIEEGQTTKLSKENDKGQKRSTKHTHQFKDRVTWTGYQFLLQ